MIILHLLITAVVGYLLGGISGGIISSKYVFKKDIRKYGSGNPGLTNFYRVFGAKGVLLVLAIDILKAAITCLFGRLLFGSLYGMPSFGAAFAAFFVMLGHAYPVYYGFRGGKTVLSAGTALFFVDWRIAVIAFSVFVILLVLTKYVSLGSMAAAVAYAVSTAALGHGIWVVILAVLSAALLIFRHKENIKRLVSHSESKFSFKRKKGTEQ
ncbi:MAG: glycerol-3-phosphate 1-O-acyltransferase PlsY [Oscillospiraceae bacterium]|nr:glycerol-3-phosphate 1-O-acyltransferase PlsY [Oscillospiraceae bacterium]